MYKKCVHGATQEENNVVFLLKKIRRKLRSFPLEKKIRRKLRSFPLEMRRLQFFLKRGSPGSPAIYTTGLDGSYKNVCTAHH